MENEIQFSNENIHALLDSSPVATLLVDFNGKIVFCNQSASVIFQYHKEELLSLSIEELIPHEFRERHIHHRKEYEKTSSQRKMGGRRELFGLKKNQELESLEIGLNPIEIDHHRYVLVSILSISERQQFDKERLLLDQKIQQTQKLESLNVLASGIAHDFNNILMGIIGNTSLILEDLSHVSPIRSQVEQIQKGARKASALTKQMLAYTGKGSYNVLPINLSELVDEMISLLEVSIPKGIALNRNLSNALPFVQVDTTQMTQVIMNLITNASEAIEDGHGMISISTWTRFCDEEYLEELEIGGEINPGTYVCLEVSDTGKGMDLTTKAKIFDPFYTTKFTGRGLGLAAVLGIIRSHNGCIKVYSEVEKGTSFKLYLPAVQSERNDQNPVLSESQHNSSFVLVIDDDEDVMASIVMMLEKMNIVVLTATNGEEGLQLFELHQGEIDMVILDYIMPDMNGDEVLKKLLDMDPTVKVVTSSGYNERTVNHSHLGYHTAGFLQKPFSYPEFKTLVEKILSAD